MSGLRAEDVKEALEQHDDGVAGTHQYSTLAAAARRWLARSNNTENGSDVSALDPGKDGTPAWAYDEDGYCVCCGNGRWKHHMPERELRDALDALSGYPQDEGK